MEKIIADIKQNVFYLDFKFYDHNRTFVLSIWIILLALSELLKFYTNLELRENVNDDFLFLFRIKCIYYLSCVRVVIYLG